MLETRRRKQNVGRLLELLKKELAPHTHQKRPELVLELEIWSIISQYVDHNS